MKKIYAVIFVVGAFLFLMGCTVPQFHTCCIYTNATENLCVLNDGTIYDTQVCEMNLGTCNVTDGEGNKLTLPVCPDRKEGACNVSCAGVFCGKYEYDPRPLFSISDAVKLDTEGNPAPDADRLAPGTGGDVAIGLYNSECRVENMTPAFLNAVTNGQGLTLNIFRFGVGNSFQEFDEASMYYPLTDKACELNQMGSVDRYVNYAIPNTLVAGSGGSLGGAICRENAFGPGIWGCIPNLDIRSYSYQDCAARCLLDRAGDSAAVNPGDAYLTERNDGVWGNPFAYGVPDYGSSAIIKWAYSEPGSSLDVPSYMLIGRDAKGSAVPQAGFSDDYSYGYTYYGAQFGNKNWLPGAVLANFGAPAFSTGSAYDYYHGQDSILEKASFGDGAVEENFLTVERDPHALYAYLLSQHSVYGAQIWQGHYGMDGEWKPGAEFECTQAGGECISGFCNTQDYKRGACKRLMDAATGETKEVNCGCWEEGGETVCNGEIRYSTVPWDRYGSSARVNATTPLSAPASSTTISFLSSSVTQTAMPSKGKVVEYDVGGYGTADGEKDYVLVIQLGGGSAYPDYSSVTYVGGVDSAEYVGGTLTIPQVLSGKKWAGCSAAEPGACGKFYTTFVDECMPSASEDPNAYYYLRVCYPFSYFSGTYGSLLDPYGGEVADSGHIGLSSGDPCRKLVEADRANDYEAFCYERNADGDCVLYSASALVVIARDVEYTDASGATVTAHAFGNCLFDEGGNKLDTTTYGYCDQCSFLTMAKDEVVALPDEQVDDYEDGDGTRLDNKYCPNLEISTLYPPWENGALQNSLARFPDSWAGGAVHDASGSGESNPYRYSTCTMPDGTEAGKQVAWPDYLPNGYYLKSKIESYLKRNIQPVIFAEYPTFSVGSGEGLYEPMSGSSPPYTLVVKVKDDGTIDAAKTTSPFMVSLAQERPALLDAMDDDAEPGEPTYYVSGGTFLADSVMDQGPAIIVVKKLREADFAGGAPPVGFDTEPSESIDWTLEQAGRRIGLLCPNCMVSVASGYDDSLGAGIPVRMYQVSRMFEYTNATTGEPLWDYAYYYENASCFDEGVSCDYATLGKVDIIAVRWQLGGRNFHCEIEGEEERFAAVLSDEMEFGAKVLRRFGKPLVVTDFSIRRNYAGFEDCLNDEVAKRFMVYLGQHTSDLVKSGHTGLIYSDWTVDRTGDVGTTAIRTEEGGVGGYRGDFFEGTFDAAALFAGKKKETFYSMVGVSEKCECAPCTALDNPSVCNGKFLGTGAECYGYEGGANVKWPANCVSQDSCIPPDMMPGYKVSCNVYYNNGTESQENYSGSEIGANPQLYPDVIASIIYGDKVPCVESSGKNISYLKLDTGGYRAYPLLFRLDGNLSVDCAQPPLAAFGEACGVSLPVSERRLECAIAPLDMRIELPLPGADIVTRMPAGGAIGGAGVPGAGAGIGGAGIGG